MTEGGGALFWQRINVRLMGVNGRLMGNYILVYPNLGEVRPKIAEQMFRSDLHA